MMNLKKKLPYCIQFILSYVGGFSIIYLQFVLLQGTVNPTLWVMPMQIAFIAIGNVFGIAMSLFYRLEVKEMQLNDTLRDDDEG